MRLHLFFKPAAMGSPRLALFLGGVVRSGGRWRAEAVFETGYLCTWGNVAVYEGLPRRDHCWLKTTIHSPLDRGSASPSEFLDEGAERFREAASLLPSPPLLPYPLQPVPLAASLKRVCRSARATSSASCPCPSGSPCCRRCSSAPATQRPSSHEPNRTRLRKTHKTHAVFVGTIPRGGGSLVTSRITCLNTV